MIQGIYYTVYILYVIILACREHSVTSKCFRLQIMNDDHLIFITTNEEYDTLHYLANGGTDVEKIVNMLLHT